jgi:hypothetical protein
MQEDSHLSYASKGTDDSPSESALPAIDDQLHNTLLENYFRNVDPIVRVLHWPSFAEKCRVLRQGPPSQRLTQISRGHTSAYISGSSANSRQSTPCSSSTDVPPPARPPESHSSLYMPPSSSFVALLFSIYYASVSSIIHSPNPPDLGSGVDTVALWSAFRKEAFVRSSTLDSKFVRSSSIELLQAMVIFMVSFLAIVVSHVLTYLKVDRTRFVCT